MEGGRAGPARRPAKSVAPLGDEVELRASRVVVLELHLTTDVPVLAGPSGDREDAVAGVIERPLDRDLPLRQERGPTALPRLADHDAGARSLIGTDLLGVGGVEHLVRKREDVAGMVGLRSIGDGIGCRVLDHLDPVTGLGLTVTRARVHRDYEHHRDRQQRECEYPLHLNLLVSSRHGAEPWAGHARAGVIGRRAASIPPWGFADATAFSAL